MSYLSCKLKSLLQPVACFFRCAGPFFIFSASLWQAAAHLAHIRNELKTTFAINCCEGEMKKGKNWIWQSVWPTSEPSKWKTTANSQGPTIARLLWKTTFLFLFFIISLNSYPLFLFLSLSFVSGLCSSITQKKYYEETSFGRDLALNLQNWWTLLSSFLSGLRLVALGAGCWTVDWKMFNQLPLPTTKKHFLCVLMGLRGKCSRERISKHIKHTI